MWFPKQHAKQYLNKVLTLPASGKEQDWEVELADSNRIEEFIEFFKKTKLSIDAEEALVALILASFEDAIWCSTFNNKDWQAFAQLILEAPEKYQAVLRPWVVASEGEGFAVSKYINYLLK